MGSAGAKITADMSDGAQPLTWISSLDPCQPPFEAEALMLIRRNLQRRKLRLRGVKYLSKVMQFIGDGFELRQLDL